MAIKIFILTLITLLVFVNVHGNDDFREVEDEKVEPEVEMDKSENDEASEKEPRLFRRSRFRGIRTRRSTSTVRNRIGTNRGFFTRRSTVRSGSTRTRFFRGNTGGGTSRTRSGFFRRLSTRNGAGSTRRVAGGSSARRTGGGIGLPSLGTVVDILQLGTDVANTVLNSIGNVERKIVVGLGNKGEADWTAGIVFMETGSSLELLPLEVSSGEGVQLAGVKPTGYERKGVAGCLCYEFFATVDDETIKLGKSFCLMFKVPWSGDNYWNVKIYDGLKQADKATFDDLVNSGPMKAGAPVAEKELARDDDKGLVYYMNDSSMTNGGQAVLQAYVGVKDAGKKKK